MPLFLLLAFSFSKEIEQNLMRGIILPVALVPQRGTLAAPGKIVSLRLWATLMWNAFESIKSDPVYIVAWKCNFSTDVTRNYTAPEQWCFDHSLQDNILYLVTAARCPDARITTALLFSGSNPEQCRHQARASFCHSTLQYSKSYTMSVFICWMHHSVTSVTRVTVSILNSI